MNTNIDDSTELWLWDLERTKENKAKVPKFHNKKVKPKNFQTSDLVWELVLPIGTKDPAYGKWSPNWQGPFRVVDAAPRNSYRLETLEGVRFRRNINGKYLKKYYPSLWIGS